MVETELCRNTGRAMPGSKSRAGVDGRNTWRIQAARLMVFAGATCAAAPVPAADEVHGGRRATVVEKPSWEFALTAYPTFVRNGDDYTSAIAVADRGPLHLEARYNYEAIGARSAFAGWTFSGGETLKWELTPILGGTWGTMKSFVPGLEASLSWGRLDLYLEAEHVRDRTAGADNYNYMWSEVGFKPVDWLRVGVVAQRTRVYGGERDLQRGPFAQVAWGPVTVGGFWFNPGSQDQVLVASLGVAF